VDLYCRICGEPWAIDSLHDAAEDLQKSFKDVSREFRSKGCEALGLPACAGPPSEATDSTYGLRPQEAASALYDLLGDDVDGAAAMLEDMGY
jgi:hypothetical protein